jgi:hypothetical protein
LQAMDYLDVATFRGSEDARLEPSSQCPRAAGEWNEEVRGGRWQFDA